MCTADISPGAHASARSKFGALQAAARGSRAPARVRRVGALQESARETPGVDIRVSKSVRGHTRPSPARPSALRAASARSFARGHARRRCSRRRGEPASGGESPRIAEAVTSEQDYGSEVAAYVSVRHKKVGGAPFPWRRTPRRTRAAQEDVEEGAGRREEAHERVKKCESFAN